MYEQAVNWVVPIAVTLFSFTIGFIWGLTFIDRKDSGDENHPISAEWLMSVGFTEVSSDMGREYRPHYMIGALRVWEFSNTGVWVLNDCDRVELKTRDDVRRLAAMMGEELREG
jgi:hypothetical protein